MASALNQITQLIAPDRSRSQDHDWDLVEAALGTPLPLDYKNLVDLYGPGSFDDFLWILQPASENQNLDLLTQTAVRLDALRSLQAQGEVVPYEIDMEREAILPWAITDNGDVCYWHRVGETPDDWAVTLNESRGPEWEEFGTSSTEFLWFVLSGQRRAKIFSDDFPSEQPGFDPIGA